MAGVIQRSSHDMIYLHDPTALPHLILECDEQAPARNTKSAYGRPAIKGRLAAGCHAS